jgi:hypothetical protein
MFGGDAVIRLGEEQMIELLDVALGLNFGENVQSLKKRIKSLPSLTHHIRV